MELLVARVHILHPFRYCTRQLCTAKPQSSSENRGEGGSRKVQFKIKKTTPLRKLMDAYCSRLGLQASQVRFMVDGERIAADDTAEKLGLEERFPTVQNRIARMEIPFDALAAQDMSAQQDEDLIDVAMEQTGKATRSDGLLMLRAVCYRWPLKDPNDSVIVCAAGGQTTLSLEYICDQEQQDFLEQALSDLQRISEGSNEAGSVVSSYFSAISGAVGGGSAGRVGPGDLLKAALRTPTKDKCAVRSSPSVPGANLEDQAAFREIVKAFVEIGVRGRLVEALRDDRPVQAQLPGSTKEGEQTGPNSKEEDRDHKPDPAAAATQRHRFSFSGGASLTAEERAQ
ncbi:Ubiquitin-like protein SMT3 [Symbiodinium microadriaticum]|uniref:Ubiquitin-like protein SMT3 n=1 Tax=Symbiodinium microadriaticum TaxID=2951 RepID=A0A1Q9D8R3_SYMMI|nr:Ubiquitin-like protein SMT3 [Symbiodinium microadriaticum]